jgi:hypothetical protein
VIEFVTLDGVMQGLGSPDEDRDAAHAALAMAGRPVDVIRTATGG